MTRLRIGESKLQILELLKRRGPGTIPSLAADCGLTVETVRAHVRALGAEGLVRQEGARRRGRGRPERVYRLASSARKFFPGRETEVLNALVGFLKDQGRDDLVERFFRRWIAQRRPVLQERLQGLEGPERLEELAKSLTEEGFMAEVDRTDENRPLLRLCNCPFGGLIAATVEPCRSEMGLVCEMLGAPLERIDHIPSGDHLCSYEVVGGL